jgi:hypothetical protein
MNRMIAASSCGLGLLMAGHAMAAQAQIDYVGFSGTSVRINWVANGYGTSINNRATQAGVFTFHVDSADAGTPFAAVVGQNINTFCTEIGEYAQHNNIVYDVTSDLTVMPNDDQGNGLGGFGTNIYMTSASASLLNELFNYKYADAISGTTAEAAAFQLAVWEIVYELVDGDDFQADHGGANYLDNGEFTTTNIADGTEALAESWINHILATDNTGGTVWGFHQDGHQDQLILFPVPVPAPVALAGVGLLGLAFGRKRLSRVTG